MVGPAAVVRPRPKGGADATMTSGSPCDAGTQTQPHVAVLASGSGGSAGGPLRSSGPGETVVGKGVA